MSKRKVLLVDDEPNLRITLADILEDEGFEVDTANNGQVAVDACKQSLYDAVLMDVRMPVMDGLSAFVHIHNSTPTIPVILMSAYATEETRETAQSDGVYAFLTKPVDLMEMLTILDQALAA